ncbi:MAG: TetR/AcrR family transcriptional regulator C-terminal domain-containing protein, partial [Spirochaetia bacterium]|nr:TetR/AcrR family transcriptional regulator C-terminal domain-containing protein [Spirochaetia bacterium]
FALAFFKHVGLRRPLAKALGGRYGAPVVMNQIETQMIRYFRENWIKGKGRGIIKPAQAEGAAVAAASALLGLMKWWLESDNASSPEAMAGLYNQIILPGLASFLNEKKVL